MNIQLTGNLFPNVTILSNDFIDHDMIHADGEYVKIYLLLLRLSAAGQFQGIEQLADLLDLTQKDVSRALKHWEKQGLLTLSQPEEKAPAGTGKPEDASPAGEKQIYVEVAPSKIAVPQKETLAPIALKYQLEQADLRHSVFMAETFLGRPLTATELNSFCYIDTALNFSSDLLEFLIEYCVSRDKKSVRYMESVAINWYQQGIDTVEKAKSQTNAYQNHTFSIMKAFGLGNRNPGRKELDYMKSWHNMGFDFPIIEEAINRTLLTTHQSSFPYANSILESWKKAGVRTMEEIKKLDSSFHASSQNPQQTAPAQTQHNKQANKFHNFEQRDYDYEDLESRLLQSGF